MKKFPIEAKLVMTFFLLLGSLIFMGETVNTWLHDENPLTRYIEETSYRDVSEGDSVSFRRIFFGD